MSCADGDLVEVVRDIARGVYIRYGRSKLLVDDDLPRIIALRAKRSCELRSGAAAERGSR